MRSYTLDPIVLPTGWCHVRRFDRGIDEHVCPHGVGHPDPLSIKEGHDGIHGCDGCCSQLPSPCRVFADTYGFPLYGATIYGEIINLRTEKALKPRVDKRKGYLRIDLSIDGKRLSRWVHRLVALAWIGHDERPVRHLDGDSTNNCRWNLAYGTQEENEADKRVVGTHTVGVRNGGSRYTKEQVQAVLSAISGDVGRVARELGMSERHARRIRKGEYRSEG